MKTQQSFSPQQKLIVVMLALTQFTVILDFMVMSPLGDMLMKSMKISPDHFGIVVAAYAFSAGISGLLTAGFADKYDRKKLLIFFYAGFIVGTLCCGLAQTYPMLVAARIVTGIFGGVIGSVSMAIITDLFPLEMRGRVMGFMQMGFGASQVLGIPISLYIANHWGWEAPFFMVVILAALVMALIVMRLPSVTAHLALQSDKSPVQHLLHTFSKRNYRIAFLATALLSVGGFMMMPFGSAFAINNLHVTTEQLPLLFTFAGCVSLISVPLIGKLSDKIDKFALFSIASLYTMVMVVVYTNLGPSPFWIIILLNVLMLVGILSRMVPATALISAVPQMQDRGAFMSINASLQSIAGGLAAVLAGRIVIQKNNFSPLEHYDTVGWVVVGFSMVGIFLLGRVSKMIKTKNTAAKEPELAAQTS
ncbi:Predicted arabinose efflux permease, MFS family [Chitinophaga jiangningensis]|uniref:Predicted arabinose efflux permease, MFS family n=1 Tax=Chitinophaga jiangningensis TaxID=1419482 RepID=A0A1M7L5Z5_9BACT|nr:MFS transporter [Chitinophaga jiangningensis]SHM73211.1 Predicted arabinose efflux permease, MFS family [Chitinophaga jiangningensis]